MRSSPWIALAYDLELWLTHLPSLHPSFRRVLVGISIIVLATLFDTSLP